MSDKSLTDGVAVNVLIESTKLLLNTFPEARRKQVEEQAEKLFVKSQKFFQKDSLSSLGKAPNKKVLDAYSYLGLAEQRMWNAYFEQYHDINIQQFSKTKTRDWNLIPNDTLVTVTKHGSEHNYTIGFPCCATEDTCVSGRFIKFDGIRGNVLAEEQARAATKEECLLWVLTRGEKKAKNTTEETDSEGSADEYGAD